MSSYTGLTGIPARVEPAMSEAYPGNCSGGRQSSDPQPSGALRITGNCERRNHRCDVGALRRLTSPSLEPPKSSARLTDGRRNGHRAPGTRAPRPHLLPVRLPSVLAHCSAVPTSSARRKSTKSAAGHGARLDPVVLGRQARQGRQVDGSVSGSLAIGRDSTRPPGGRAAAYPLRECPRLLSRWRTTTFRCRTWSWIGHGGRWGRPPSGGRERSASTLTRGSSASRAAS